MLGNGSEPSASTIQSTNSPQIFEFQEILSATKNFAKSLEIGEGGFGKVHLANGVRAAIKRLDPKSKQGPKEFEAEVAILPKLHHPNIVSLIGYYEDQKEKILVYEYANNGTVHDHLHKHRTPLSWLLRINIGLGAARGLCYLHDDTGIDSGVIHGDFKSSNVLLHGLEPKISDFGLSKICQKNAPSTFVHTSIKGTFGCIDPCYYQTGKLRRKTDVYAFAVFLLEMLCRKPVLDEGFYGEGRNLVKWATIYIKKEKCKQITDPDIWDEISPECLKKYISIVESCLHDDLGPRPTMAEVVVALEDVLTSQVKFNRSLKRLGAGSGTIFGKIVDMFPFSFNRENSSICGPSLEEFRFADLRNATGQFSLDSLSGEGSYGKVYLGQVNQKSSASSKQVFKIDVAVKMFKHKLHDHWQVSITTII